MLAMPETNFPSWLTMLVKLSSSVTFVGVGKLTNSTCFLWVSMDTLGNDNVC